MTQTTSPTDIRVRASKEAKARTLLQVAATTSGVGILLAAAGDATLARWLTVFGLMLLVIGLHRFGRLGADEPLDFESSPPA